MLGGVLNLCGIVFPLSVRLCVLAGVILCVPDVVAVMRDRRRHGKKIGEWLRDPFLVMEVIILVFLILFQIWASTGRPLNPHDDCHAYAVYPVKMLQTGSLGTDPFNARRMYTSLGGQYFLQSEYLGLSDVESLFCVELGVGWLCLLALILGCGLRRGGEPRAVLGLGILLHAATFRVVNTSSTITGAALAGALFAVVTERECLSPLRRGILIGLLAAGAASLKTSHVPIVGSIVPAGQLARTDRPLRDRMGELAVAGSCALLLLFSWMVETYRNCGSPMYPFFGTGRLGAAGGEYHLPGLAAGMTGLVRVVGRAIGNPLWLLGAALTALWAFRRNDRASGAVATGLWIAYLATVMAAWVSIGALRFGLPMIVVATWLLAAECLVLREKDRRRWPTVVAFALVAFYAGVAATSPKGLLASNWEYFRRPCRELAGQVGPTRELQRAVPSGEKMLVRLAKPYALNFRRNPIYVVDWPGIASPRPGIPLRGEPEELAAYLRHQGIRYVAYSYVRISGINDRLFRK